MKMLQNMLALLEFVEPSASGSSRCFPCPPLPTPPTEICRCNYPKIRIPALLFAIFLFVVGCNQNVELSKELSGKWKGKSADNQAVVMSFETNNTLHLSVGDDSGIGIYRVDFTKQPAYLDIDFGERGKSETILEFIDKKRMRIENIEPFTTRPSKFSANSVVLTKDE